MENEIYKCPYCLSRFTRYTRGRNGDYRQIFDCGTTIGEGQTERCYEWHTKILVHLTFALLDIAWAARATNMYFLGKESAKTGVNYEPNPYRIPWLKR